MFYMAYLLSELEEINKEINKLKYFLLDKDNNMLYKDSLFPFYE